VTTAALWLPRRPEPGGDPPRVAVAPGRKVPLDEFSGRGKIRIGDQEVIEQLLLVFEEHQRAGRVA
jgi:hypothetical protein